MLSKWVDASCGLSSWHCMQVSWFDFAPSLQQLMQDADLVISHAGSGSLFEALHLRKVSRLVPSKH